MICALVSRDTRLQEQLKAVSRMGGALDERELPLARQLAEKDWIMWWCWRMRRPLG